LVQLDEPARARASELVPDCRSTRLPSVATDQVPPDVVQPVELPSSKSSENSVAANAFVVTTTRPATRASAAAASASGRHRRRGFAKLSLIGRQIPSTIVNQMGKRFPQRRNYAPVASMSMTATGSGQLAWRS
jgi:hypothetical protein